MTEKDEEKCLENITEQERDIAQTAYAEFKKKNYGACLQHINSLDSKANDFKVMHNKAVIEYYKSDFKKTEAFQNSLNAINNKFQIKIEKLDDVDHCIAHFNQAVLLYHQRQYTASQRVMDRVYKFIEPMEDTLAKQVSLLAIELQLCMRQPDKALTLITYLENNLIPGNAPLIKGSDKKLKEKEKKIPIDPVAEEFKKKLLKYKARCYLMSHSLITAAKELQALSKVKPNVDHLFMSANLEYLKGNIQEAMKILQMIDQDALIYSDCGESSAIMCSNNTGVLMHSMRKPNLACHYFQEALKKDIDINLNTKKESNDKPVYTLGGSKYHELMYNLGISMLYAGKPTQAFECLIIAVRRYHRNSRLWMRLAECCIMVHKSTNEVDFDIQRKQKELIVDMIGSKEKQKIVINSHLSNDKKYSCDSQSYAVPVPSLEFALLCLRNAYLLIPSDTATNPAPLFLIPGVSPPAPLPNPGPAPSNPLMSDSIQSLKNHILVSSAYVSLCLGDYIIALEHARNALEQPKISGVHKLLAHMYAAESLVLLDKISEALEHLNPENVKELTFGFPRDGSVDEVKTAPPPKWFPTNLGSAHSVLQYNIAVAKTIRGQLDQAHVILKQVWQQRSATCKVPAHIIMLVIYIELKLGHADIARNLIKQHFVQPRISG